MTRKTIDRQALVRNFFKESGDGATARRIRQCTQLAMGKNASWFERDIEQVLKAMPDAYIDRWARHPIHGLEPVWDVVVVPENCPRPVD